MSSKHFVYVIGPRDGPFKIGFATNVQRRRSIANVGNPKYLHIHYVFETGSKAEAEAVERDVHFQFSETHIRGEWFNLSAVDLPKIRQTIHNTKFFKLVPEGWSLSRKTAEEFTPDVCRMARTALGMSTLELSKAAGVPEATVHSFEEKSKTPVESSDRSTEGGSRVPGR
jgi:hypothetical protein